ncbi:GMC oxidoreductase [Microbacterium allomyrinae]|uniref:GMC family oxidoreductase n=1 Tax=Microbacterium allomyrinae TaxID=2830666 RepID=A0A9X1LUP9_9MICO|nr:GMC oxidoreductase [Microbacterium allomyrinae]MCC2032467.1 GMC family oxidoreductase [Microbacterium allomyrinae]
MVDVVVVGLGPAGIVAAHVLASAGLSVVAAQARADAGGRAALVSPAPTVRTHDAEEALPHLSPQAGRDEIGGSKLLAAPQAYRLDEWSLRGRSTADRCGGALPTDADLVDWPIGLDDLAPWYDLVERAMAVGARPPTPWTDRMSRAARSLGWEPFAAPAAASKDASGLLDDSGVEIMPATVTALLRGSTGAITGVEYVDALEVTRTLACRAVVVAASVIPTVRLLLLSDITAAGKVGRWFMSHNSFVVHGDFPGVDLGRRDAGPASAVAVAEFEGGGFDHTGLGFLGGSILQAAMTGPWTDDRVPGAAAGLDPATTNGAEPEAWVRANHASIGTVWAQPDQLPRWDNAIDLDPVHRDAAGRPVARVTFALADDDARRWEFLSERAAQWLRESGARTTWRPPLAAQPLGTHLYGGARMGDSPETSVVDSFGRFHDVPGLVIVGSSTFPTTGGRGPVETIEALSWRSATQLVEDLR